MNALPNSNDIATELQSEITDWMADDTSNQSNAPTDFDRVVVDDNNSTSHQN